MTKPRNILISLALKYNGDWDKMLSAIKNKEVPDEALMEKAENTKAVTIVDTEYPTYLRQSFKPPLVLFYKGNPALMNSCSRNIAYIGTRNESAYGAETAKSICSGLIQKGCRIISGFARGIDATALKTALDNGGEAIAVLGSGIDNCYPNDCKALYDELAEKGLILSEYPDMTAPDVENFPLRNRIVASMAKALIVGEAKRKSDAMLTVNYALSQGKDVGCVPYHAHEDSACNALIKDGAFLIENAQDALLMLGMVSEA